MTQSWLVWILGFNSSNICTKLLASCWTLKRSWLHADAIDLDDLQRKCTDFATAFPDDVDGARLVDEIQDCRILVSRRVGVDVTPLGILKFIVSFGGNDAFPNFKVGLQILLTVLAANVRSPR